MPGSERLRPDAPGRPGPGWGSYAGKGIWSYSVASRETRELAQPQRLRDLLRTLTAEFRESLPPLYAAWALDDTRGQWEVFPDQALFKVTTAGGRRWYAHYGLVSSWNHQTHSWLWSWAFPREWTVPAPATGASWALHRESARQGWTPGCEPSLLVNEGEALRLAYLAAHVSGLPLVYRSKVNEVNTHFFVLGQPAWAS